MEREVNLYQVKTRLYEFQFSENDLLSFSVVKSESNTLFYLILYVNGDILKIGHTSSFSALVKSINKYADLSDWVYMALRTWCKPKNN